MGEWVNGKWVPSNQFGMFQDSQSQVPQGGVSMGDWSTLTNVDPSGLQQAAGVSNVDAWNNASGSILGATTPTTETGGMFSNFGGENGWGAPAIQGLSSLANSWLGFQNLGVAKDQLNFQKDAYADQRADYNKNTAQRDAALLSSSK